MDRRRIGQGNLDSNLAGFGQIRRIDFDPLTPEIDQRIDRVREGPRNFLLLWRLLRATHPSARHTQSHAFHVRLIGEGNFLEWSRL